MKKTPAKKTITKSTPTKSASPVSAPAPKNTTGIQPLGDRVVIREDDSQAGEKTTATGIIIPVTVSKEKNGLRGIVVAVGPGRMEDGMLIAPSVKAGDSVLFQWGDKIRMGDDDYYIVRENEILAIITK